MNPVVDGLAELVPDYWSPTYALRVVRFLNLVIRAIWKVYGDSLAEAIARTQGDYQNLCEYLPDEALQDPYDLDDEDLPF